MKKITKHYLSNPESGAPINSSGVVLAVGEDIEVPEAVAKELSRRYAFLSYSSKVVLVKTKKVKKDKVEEKKEDMDEMSLEGLSVLAKKAGVTPSKIEKVLVKRLIAALPVEHKEEKELVGRLNKELARIEKEAVAVEKKAAKKGK